MTWSNKENSLICLVFPLGMELGPFLERVEVRRRWKRGNATYREVFFEGHRLLVIRCGVGPQRAATAIAALEPRPGAIVGLGTAGSLVKDLQVGQMIVATETVSESGSNTVLKSDDSLVRAIQAACAKENLPCIRGRIVSVKDAVFSHTERKRLHELTGACAVDMESHAIATQAEKWGIPVAFLRVVSDDVDSPQLPDLAAIRASWRNPLKWPHLAVGLWRWRLFLRDFRRVVKLLTPPALRLIRGICGKGQ